MEIKRFSIDAEGEKKRKRLVLKAKDPYFDCDMSLIVKYLNIFVRHEKQQKMNRKNMRNKYMTNDKTIFFSFFLLRREVLSLTMIIIRKKVRFWYYQQAPRSNKWGSYSD